MNDYVLSAYYMRYLKEIRKVSDSTVKHYQDALNNISRYLVRKNEIKQSIYEVQDIEELNRLQLYLLADPDFLSQDKRGHQMYSAGFNNYIRFANGTEFAAISQGIKALDIEIPVPEKLDTLRSEWKRSNIIKNQSLESAGYQCEIDPHHRTFISKNTGRAYMEGHHVLPLRYQEQFHVSLDVYANIVCLCPICHRLLHYGIESDKVNVINKLYHDRIERLASSGVKLSKNEFVKMSL